MSEARNAVDEALEELHELRRAIDAQFDHDPQKYIAHLREVHEQLLREGWTEAPPPPGEYVERVRQAVERVRQNPHLLELSDEVGSAEGDASQRHGTEAENASGAVRQTAGPRQQDRSAA